MTKANLTLSDRFITPPLSILNCTGGELLRRKNAWERILPMEECGGTREGALGMGDEVVYADLYRKTQKKREKLGVSFREYLRDYATEEEMQRALGNSRNASSTSLFNPAIAEVCATWFTPHPNSDIFDPFAGDTRKGAVFGKLGHNFTGIELRREQVEENNRALDSMDFPRGASVRYVCDDGRNVKSHVNNNSQDLLFTCPPYFNLEVYSDDPRDASAQATYEGFANILQEAFARSVECLRNNRFAIVVIGDVRDSHGGYYGLPQDVQRIFKSIGLAFVNEIIIADSVSRSLIGAARAMRNRKVSKRHQQILVFYKGDPRNVSKEFVDIDSRADVPSLIGGELCFGGIPKGVNKDGQMEFDFED